MGEKDQLRAAAQRNVLVLAAGMAALYAMVELVFGVATITFEETGGSASLAGLAPAIFLICAAFAALAAGQAMDRSGRRPVLTLGSPSGRVVACWPRLARPLTSSFPRSSASR